MATSSSEVTTDCLKILFDLIRKKPILATWAKYIALKMNLRFRIQS